MKKLYIIFMVLFSVVYTSYAQVETNYYQHGDSIPELRKSKQLISRIIQMPAFDLSKEMAENDSSYLEDYKFGKAFDVSYSLTDGLWEEVKGGRLWTMSFASKGAKSLNFVFDNFYLPEGAELYVENQDGTVVYGPVTHETISEDGFFLTDIIDGDCATISLFEPSGVYNQSSLEIKRIVHGYNIVYDNSGKESRSTIFPGLYDVADYPEYEMESDGVGLMILSSGDKIRVGSLMMSTDFSFKPYFLTALRNYDTSTNQITEQGKTDATHSLFKFRCKKIYFGNIKKKATTYTYNQADYRASYGPSHLLLLEIKGNVKSNPNLTWFGWKKNTTAPTSSAFFYIYINNDGDDIMEVWQINSPLSDNNGTNYWFIYDNFLYNPVFYGAPVIDQNKRIVGHVFNNYSNLSAIVANKITDAWLGGGTSSSQLKYWLDPNSTLLIRMDSYRSMVIEGSSQIISSRTYSVKNLPTTGGFSVVWSLSDTYYNSVIQHNTPSNNQCTITRNSSHSMSDATLTATVYRNGVVIQTLTKYVSTGSGFDGTYYNGVTTKPLNHPSQLEVLAGCTVVINSPNLIGATASVSEGNLTPTSWNLNATTGVLQVGIPDSTGAIVVKVICSDNSIYYVPIHSSFDSGILMSISQTGDLLGITVQPNRKAESRGDEPMTKDTMEWTLEVRHAMTGEEKINSKVNGACHNIDTQGWRPGVYVVRATMGKETKSEKVIVK